MVNVGKGYQSHGWYGSRFQPKNNGSFEDVVWFCVLWLLFLWICVNCVCLDVV